jgi:regulator of nucleoside diphosphate kinase
MNRILVTTNDYRRLLALLELASIKTIMPEIDKLLYNKLIVANTLPQENISKNVITMNSRVRLKELASKKEIELTIAYPQDADNRERKVSILSPIGIALLGRQVGDQVSWKIPRGKGKFEVIDITYQPEAVGDYHL